MFEVFSDYLAYLLSFLFCFVLSKLEQKERRTKTAATIVMFFVLGGLFKRVSMDGMSLSGQSNIPHLLVVTVLLAVFLGITFLGKTLLTNYLGNELFGSLEDKNED